MGSVYWSLQMQSQALRRDLAEIRYRFTSCGMTGRYGPSYQACINHYKSINSRLSQDTLVSSFTGETSLDYEGSQRFIVSRLGLYNITAYGASGGRGVCNIERGYGRAQKVQVELYPELELLILVGQRGLDYCDVESEYSRCTNLSSSLPECNTAWYNYLQSRFNNESMSDVLGGGGGGGASMVRAYNSIRGYDPDPIVIAAGGGGTSAFLQYDIDSTTEISDTESYRSFINASSGCTDNNAESRGVDSINVAGTGGGYLSLNTIERLDVDGSDLSTKYNFSTGGLTCVDMIDSVPISIGVGGFGGGGGACAGGGAGGGYIGGSILGEGKFVPGGGGFSCTDDSYSTSFKLIEYIEDIPNIQLDGFVDIIDADCECVFKCDIFTIEDQFQCTCPDDTMLAPDRSDCFIETGVEISEGIRSYLPPDENGIVFKYDHIIFENKIFLYSIDFRVIVKQEVDRDEPIYEGCIVGFLGENSELLAYTDVHRGSQPKLNTLTLVNDDGIQSQTSFLVTPVAVYSGLIVSASNCSVENMTINMNISIRDRRLEEPQEVNSSIPSEVANEFLEDFTTQLKIQFPITYSTEGGNEVRLGYGVISVISVGVVITVLIIILSFLCIGYIYKQRMSPVNYSIEEFDKDEVRVQMSRNIGHGSDYVLLHHTRKNEMTL